MSSNQQNTAGDEVTGKWSADNPRLVDNPSKKEHWRYIQTFTSNKLWPNFLSLSLPVPGDINPFETPSLNLSHLNYRVDDSLFSKLAQNSGLVQSLMKDIAKKSIYTQFFDSFDMIAVALATDDRGTQYYSRIDNPSVWGSSGRLKGMVFFSSPWSLLWGASLHEIGHHFMNYTIPTYGVRDVYPSNGKIGKDEDYTNTPGKYLPSQTVWITGNQAQSPTNYDGSHWGLSDVNGQMGGFDKADLTKQPDNRFRVAKGWAYNNTNGNVRRYAPLELWYMGLIDDDELKKSLPVTFYSDISNIDQTLQPMKKVDEKGQWVQKKDAQGRPMWDKKGYAVYETSEKKEPTGDLIFKGTPKEYKLEDLKKSRLPVKGAAKDIRVLTVVLVPNSNTTYFQAAAVNRSDFIKSITDDQVQLCLQFMSNQIEASEAFPYVGLPDPRQPLEKWSEWKEVGDIYEFRDYELDPDVSFYSYDFIPRCDYGEMKFHFYIDDKKGYISKVPWLEFKKEGGKQLYRMQLRGRAPRSELKRVLSFQMATGQRGSLTMCGHDIGVTIQSAVNAYYKEKYQQRHYPEEGWGVLDDIRNGVKRVANREELNKYLISRRPKTT